MRKLERIPLEELLDELKVRASTKHIRQKYPVKLTSSERVALTRARHQAALNNEPFDEQAWVRDNVLEKSDGA